MNWQLVELWSHLENVSLSFLVCMLILLLFLYLKIRYVPLIFDFLDVSTKYQILKLLTNTSTYSIQISTPELSVKGDYISSMCMSSAISESYQYVSRLTPRAGGNSHPQPSDLVQRDWEKRTQSANPRYSVATNYTFMLFLCSISFSTPFLIIIAVKKQIKHE